MCVGEWVRACVVVIVVVVVVHSCMTLMMVGVGQYIVSVTLGQIEELLSKNRSGRSMCDPTKVTWVYDPIKHAGDHVIAAAAAAEEVCNVM